MPQYQTWQDVPVGDQNLINSFADQWGALAGFDLVIPQWALLAAARFGIVSLRDFGQWMVQVRNFLAGGGPGNFTPSNQPWADYGLSKDEYASASATFATEYKKITGQDIPADALQKAFQTPYAGGLAGALMTSSQYAQQLMNDANIRKTYGWVQYGLDFNQWTQQKLQLRTAYGRDIQDAEAATILQYNRQTTGSGQQARAQSPRADTLAAGVGQSVAR